MQSFLESLFVHMAYDGIDIIHRLFWRKELRTKLHVGISLGADHQLNTFDLPGPQSPQHPPRPRIRVCMWAGLHSLQSSGSGMTWPWITLE